MEALIAMPIGAAIIFLLRVMDVSMAIMRMILAVRGHRGVAACIGFFEVLFWLAAVGSTLQHLTSPLHVVGYAAGFATGTYVGVWLEGRFALGTNVVQAIFRSHNEPNMGGRVAQTLRARGFAVTETVGRGRESEVDILNVVVQRKRVPEVLAIVHDGDPEAFVTVEEVRNMRNGHLPPVTGIFRPGGRKMPFLTRA